MSWRKNENKKIIRPSGANRIVVGKKRNRSKPASHFRKKIIVWTALVIFIGVTAYVLFFSRLLSIGTVSISGNNIVKTSDILGVVRGDLDGKRLGIFNDRNLIFLDESRIRNDLLDKFKQIKSVDIARKFPNKLQIGIAERKSALVFCGGDACYVVDSNGQAYAPADFSVSAFGEKNLNVLRDLSRKPIGGKIVLDSGLLQFVADIKDRLKQDLGIDIQQEIDTPALVSGDIRVQTSEGWKIFFNQSIGIGKEIEMLKTVLNDDIKDKRSDLDYVDLRVDNKVYYKLKSS